MEPAEYDLMDRVEARMWWYRALHARLIVALRGVGGPVLDAGCGTGGLLAALRREGADRDLHGLDYSATAAKRAAVKSGAVVTCGSVNALPYADGVFDAVVSADVLCHAAVLPERAVGEFHRVLKPGGRVVLNLPAYQWLHSAHDARVHNARRYTASTAAGLLEAAGFGEVRARYWNSLLLPLMVLQRKVLARGEDAASDVAVFSPWLDAILHGITALERRIPLRWPAGGSVLVTGVRPVVPR